MIRHPISKLAVLFSLLLLLGASGRAASADVILVTAAKNPIDELDEREVQNLYKGRLTSIKGKPLKPLNAVPGSIERKEFLNQMMKLNELDYTGYWHVRRYSGQGTPPLEVASQDELFELLKKQPEGIGYLWVPPGAKLDLPEGLKVIKVR